jgi:DNA-binding transcriptional ArsR family regulator
MLELVVTPHRRFKDAIYEQLARLGKAVSAPKRLELLDLLCQGPSHRRGARRAGGHLGGQRLQHLQVLRAARLVEAEKKGLLRRVPPRGRRGLRFFLGLRGLAEARLAEVAQPHPRVLRRARRDGAVAGDELCAA